MHKVPPFLMLDAWRGIAALCVMGHSCVAFLASPGNRHFIHHPIYALSSEAQLGVVMFFVISGYCIMGAAYGALASGRTVGRYLMDRIRRIYPPYLAACALAVGIGFIISFAQSHSLIPPSNHPAEIRDPTLIYWLTNILIVPVEWNQPTLLLVTWSLCYEIVFYALLGLLLAIAKIPPFHSSAIWVFQAGLGGLTLTSMVWLIVSPGTCPFPMDRWYQFGVGALLFMVLAARPGIQARIAQGQLIGAGLLILLFAVLHTNPFVLGHPSTRAQATTCLLFVAILWGLRAWDKSFVQCHVGRPLMWLGTISYSLYLIHPLVIAFPDVLGRHLGFDREWYWVTYLGQIALSIFMGWVFYYLVERHFISSRQKQRITAELNL